MFFSPSPSRPVREFSLAELVAKISELEQRRQAGRSTAETGRRDGSHSSGSRPDWTTASPGSTEPELTE